MLKKQFCHNFFRIASELVYEPHENTGPVFHVNCVILWFFICTNTHLQFEELLERSWTRKHVNEAWFSSGVPGGLHCFCLPSRPERSPSPLPRSSGGAVDRPRPLVMGMDSPSGHGPSWYLISLATVTGPWRGHMPESGPVRTLHGMSIHGECMRKVLVCLFFFFLLEALRLG